MKGAKYTKRGDGDVTMKPTHHVSNGDQTDTQMWVFKKQRPWSESQNSGQVYSSCKTV